MVCLPLSRGDGHPGGVRRRPSWKAETMKTGKTNGMIAATLLAAALLAAALPLPAMAGLYAFFDPDETGIRLWSYSAAWFTCNDYVNDQTKHRGNITALGNLPTNKQTLMVDSDKLTPETPLVIDPGREVVVNQLFMANFLGAPYGDEPHTVALEVGEGATLRTTQANNNFQVGACENGRALLLVDSNALVSNINFRIGASGFGVVTNRGGRVFGSSGNNNQGMFLGYNSTGSGVYAQVSGQLTARCHVGRDGEGLLEISGGEMGGHTFLGEQSGGRGTAVFSGVAVTNQATIGCAAGAWGCLHLRGATNYADTVKIRDNEAAYGQLRGWGAIYKYSATSACGEMNNFFMNGQTVADGEGVEGRILDLRLIRTGDGGKYSNVKVTMLNGAAGTNGWYAVNKGVLAYPMVYARSGFWSGTFGANTNENCDAVNTVRIDYNSSKNTAAWLEALLYANDSAMVPAGLQGDALGVWGFRSNVKYDNRTAQLANLTDFSLRFRYDHGGLKAGAGVSLMRYDQATGAWSRIAQVAHDPASPFISATSLTADGADYDRNLGIFAVVRDPSNGTVISFR